MNTSQSQSRQGCQPPVPASSQQLSPARAGLVKLMQRINFGRIEHLQFRGSEPLFNPTPQIVREIKLGGENGPRPELGKENFQLKQRVVQLFAYLDEQQSGVIEALEVQHGLPFRMIVREESGSR